MNEEKETDAQTTQQVSEIIPADSGWSQKGRQVRKKDEEEPTQERGPSSSLRRPSDKEEGVSHYARRFLAIRKIKDYTPVYIDVRMKEKLQTLITSLQHIAPEITPTMLLTNLLFDHIAANRELITRAANEGLKRSLASTFDNGKE